MIGEAGYKHMEHQTDFAIVEGKAVAVGGNTGIIVCNMRDISIVQTVADILKYLKSDQ